MTRDKAFVAVVQVLVLQRAAQGDRAFCGGLSTSTLPPGERGLARQRAARAVAFAASLDEEQIPHDVETAALDLVAWMAGERGKPEWA